MTLNPLQWIRWLIAEWAPACVLRERLGLAHDRIAELERKYQETTIALQRKHSQEVASLRQSHDHEVRRLIELYSSGRGILPPAKVNGSAHSLGHFPQLLGQIRSWP